MTEIEDMIAIISVLITEADHTREAVAMAAVHLTKIDYITKGLQNKQINSSFLFPFVSPECIELPDMLERSKFLNL